MGEMTFFPYHYNIRSAKSQQYSFLPLTFFGRVCYNREKCREGWCVIVAARTIEVQTGQRVVDTGLYGIVRHPMYAVTLWLFLAIPVILGS